VSTPSSGERRRLSRADGWLSMARRPNAPAATLRLPASEKDRHIMTVGSRRPDSPYPGSWLRWGSMSSGGWVRRIRRRRQVRLLWRRRHAPRNALRTLTCATGIFRPALQHRYMHPELKGGDGKALTDFLSRFAPATDIDRDLLLTMVLTPFWGGEPGQRPGFLLTATAADEQAGRGVGKSTVVKMLRRLCGGFMACGANDSM